MKLFHIFNYTPLFKEGSKPYTATFLFLPNEGFNGKTLSEELKVHFQSNLIPDDLFVLGGKDILDELKDFFIGNYPTTFQFINQQAVPRFKDHVHVLTFDGDGVLEVHSTVRDGIIDKAKEIIHEGLIKIFVDRGGLIQSRYSHHFVFPSGKHSESFLRTGNILLYGPEIYFIASQLLSRYKTGEHKMILCDSSSISSLAYAMIDLKKRLSTKFQTPPVNSFKSYSVFEEDELTYGASAFILISSSTSGGIISRLNEKMKSIDPQNIALIYFLGKDEDFEHIKTNVICNLDRKHSTTGHGHTPFQTHSPDNCTLCTEKKSLPVNVVGDIFLSENPKVDRLIVKVGHAPAELARFAQEFIVNKNGSQHVLKCHYKESQSPDERYNIFVDMQEVFTELKVAAPSRYLKYRKALSDKIAHHIPAQTKHIICLEDSASVQMAEIIQQELNSTQRNPPTIVYPAEISDKISKDSAGVVVVVSSCMLTGRNLLLISKQLRDYKNLSIIYMVGLVRTRNRENYKFIKSNLVQTAKGRPQNSFVEIEKICIPDDSVGTIWQTELAFLGKLIDHLERDPSNQVAHQFYSKRRGVLESVDDTTRGLANNLFYGTISTNRELALNKNFAFLEAEIHEVHSQSDVYFIMSMIINHLRQCQHEEDTLVQTEYRRQLIDPSNFLRYNDGIIQASILRSATAQELAYDLDYDCSLQISQVIENEIKLSQTGMDEALHEFVYAIASGNLKLKSNHVSKIFDKVIALNNPVLSALCEYYLHAKKTKRTKAVVSRAASASESGLN